MKIDYWEKLGEMLDKMGYVIEVRKKNNKRINEKEIQELALYLLMGFLKMDMEKLKITHVSRP